MGVYLSETVVVERALAAGVNGPFDMSVNPISFVLLHVRASAAAGAADLAQLLAHLEAIVVTFKGTSIVSMSGADLVRLVHVLWGRAINLENFGVVLPGLVSFTIPIPFTRVPFWSKEAFPATRRGELTMAVTRSAVLTNITAPQFAVESVTLLEADPQQFLKMVTLSRAIAIGDADMELPIGNPVLGLQIFSPVAMANDPIAETIRRLRLLVDNVEMDIGDASFDAHRAISFLRAADLPEYVALPSSVRNYTYVDLDPLKDDGFALETEGRASVRLRFVPDVGGTVRVTPVELVRLGGVAAGVGG